MKRAIAQSRLIAIAYLALGALGLVSLIQDRSLPVVVTAIVPTVIGAVEWILHRQLVKSKDPRVILQLFFHQVWVLCVGVVILWWFFHLSIEPYLQYVPPLLMDQLDEQLQPLGITGADYMRIVWKVFVVLLTGIFVIKQSIFLFLYFRSWRMETQATA